jgi:hypothetical protein
MPPARRRAGTRRCSMTSTAAHPRLGQFVEGARHGLIGLRPERAVVGVDLLQHAAPVVGPLSAATTSRCALQQLDRQDAVAVQPVRGTGRRAGSWRS